MTDDASRASERFRGLQRWTGKDRGDAQSSWFAPDEGPEETTAPPGEPLAPAPPRPDLAPADRPAADRSTGERAVAERPSAEQRYADAIAAMNDIVSTFDFSALPWVTEVFRTTAGVLREDDPARPGVLNNLGSATQLTHVRSGELADLEDAISYYRAASTSAHAGDRDRALYHCNLALALTELAGKTARADLAAESARVAQEALQETPTRDGRRPMVLLRLANSLKLHAELSGSVESDEESIGVFREAARIFPASEASTAELLVNLGSALLRRYRRSWSLDDLDEAIKHVSTGANALADGEARRTALCRYAESLRLRFQRSGDLTDLNTAINELIGVLGVLEGGNPLLGLSISQLADATVEHVDATGESGQLRRVLRPIVPAVRAMSAEDPGRSGALAGYAAMLRRQFLHGGEAKVLDTAITAGESAVDGAPESERGRMVTALVTTLLQRFEHGEDRSDLDRAADLAQEVAKTHGTPVQYIAWVQLGRCAAHRFATSGRTKDIDNAIELFDQALITMPADAPGRAGVAISLGHALRSLHQRNGRRRYYRWARKVLAEVSGLVNAPADQRLRAAALAGRISAAEQKWSEALDSFAQAVELLPLMTRGKRVVASPSAQQRWATLVADAAACAVEAGESDRAIELIEHGRSAILADYLPTGGELGELHRSSPDLADEIVRLRRLLDRPIEDHELDGDNRLHLSEAWSHLLGEVRQIQTGHLRVKRADELSEGLPDGSVAMINLSRYRSDALVVIGGRVLTVPLTSAEPEKAESVATSLLVAAQQDDHPAMAEVLDWTWVRITRPVLDRMGYLSAPEDGDRWPRIWWSAFGAAAYLPMHAATAHAGASALDRVVSSHTPTFTALSRPRSGRGDGGAALVAAGSAEQVSRELPRQNQILAQYWPTAEIASVESASSSDMLRMLPQFPWVHVCEPSSQFPGQPAAGLLLDRDGQRPLGLIELGQVALGQAEFCYLGQCATAADTPCAAALSLPAALSFAGYAHTVGSLWEIDGASASEILADVYQEIFGQAGYGVDGAAYAVHNAARRLRGKYPDEHATWAAHLHVGP